MILSYNNIQRGLLSTVILFLVNTSCQYKRTSSSETIPSNSINKQITFDTLTQIEIEQLQTGDVLLRKGFGWISDGIANYLEEEYPITHCGIVIKDTVTLDIRILHTVSNDSIDGMHIETLAHYCQQSQQNSLIAVRLQATPTEQAAIIAEAIRLYKEKVPFDMGFDDQDSTQLYCIEMLRDVYLKVLKKDILNKRKTTAGIDVLAMSNLLDTMYFQILFNHFDDEVRGRDKAGD
jgi:hypothetical protein